MYCKYCGNQLDEKAIYCSSCGHPIDDNQTTSQENKISENTPKEDNTNKTLGTIAKILMIISCVASGIYLIPLCWTIPMTVSLSKKLEKNEEISIGFKICTLIFCNTIAGILLLCMKNDKK